MISPASQDHITRQCSPCWGEGTMYEEGATPRIPGRWTPCPQCGGAGTVTEVRYPIPAEREAREPDTERAA